MARTIVRSDVSGSQRFGGSSGYGLGKGGKGSRGLGLKTKTAKRHRYGVSRALILLNVLTHAASKILRDNIQGVTKSDIRRLARRGGVKRISGQIYDEVRTALKQRLQLVRFYIYSYIEVSLLMFYQILRDACAIVELQKRKTVTVPDVVFVLKRHGNPIMVSVTRSAQNIGLNFCRVSETR